MALYETPVYDLDELTRRNLHIHTSFSHCAKSEMTLQAIVERAVAAGVEMIALTDHYNFPEFDDCFLAQVRYLKSRAERLERKPQILFSAELSNYGIGKHLETAETAAALDYRLYTCNHFHLDFWEHPAERTARGYAVFQMQAIRRLMEDGCADCIAHPLIGRFVKTMEATAVTEAITDTELGDLSELARKTHTAWELNSSAVYGDPAFFWRLWHIGREVGAVFHFGTDAHTLDAVDSRSHAARLKEILD